MNLSTDLAWVSTIARLAAFVFPAIAPFAVPIATAASIASEALANGAGILDKIESAMKSGTLTQDHIDEADEAIKMIEANPYVGAGR